MKKELFDFCENYLENREILGACWKWDGGDTLTVSAIEATSRGRILDEDSLRKAELLLKAKTGVFSSYRSCIKIYVITKLATSRYPGRLLEESMEAYDLIKLYFSGGDYEALLSLILPELTDDPQAVIEKGKMIHNYMRETHFFLTGTEDVLYAVLMAASGKNESKAVRDMDECFETLKGKISISSDTRQAIAEILSMGTREPRFNLVRFFRLYDELNDAGYKYERSLGLTALATLAISDIPVGDALETIKDIYNHLGNVKPYRGIFGYSKKSRLVHSAILTSAYYGGFEPGNTAIISLVISLIASAHAAAAAAAAA